jgi:hypothetical protein
VERDTGNDDIETTTANTEFAAMLADEYILSFISLSAHIQPTEFYQLLLLSSSQVFQSAAAPGWTLKNISTAASSVRCRQPDMPSNKSYKFG